MGATQISLWWWPGSLVDIDPIIASISELGSGALQGKCEVNITQDDGLLDELNIKGIELLN
jgi:hypothetical protein